MTKEFILGLLSKINGAKDRAGELPGGACFMDGDTVLCLERARGESRYPYIEDGLVVWLHSSGYIDACESIFTIFAKSNFGEGPHVAFFGGVKEGGAYRPVSVTGGARPLDESGIERYIVYAPKCAYCVTTYKDAVFALRLALDKNKHIRFTLSALNAGGSDAEIYLSYFMEALLRPAEAETYWQKMTKYGRRLDNGSFILKSINREENCLVINREISGDGAITSPSFTTSRSAFLEGAGRTLDAALPLATGVIRKNCRSSTTTELPVAAEMLPMTLPAGGCVNIEFELTLCVGEDEARRIATLPVDRTLDGYLDAANRAESEEFDRLKTDFYGKFGSVDADTFTKFLKFVRRQSSFCALGKNYGGMYLGFRDVFQQLEASLMWQREKTSERMVYALNFILSSGRPPRMFSFPKEGQESIPVDLEWYIDQGCWIISTLYTYLAHTGDFSVLDEEAGYIDAPDADWCDAHFTGERTTVLEHLVRITDFLLSKIDREYTGCLRVLFGDWNDAVDGLGKAEDGTYGSGVTVMATLQFRQNLYEMKEILSFVGKYTEKIPSYDEAIDGIERGLEKFAVERKGDRRRIVHGWGDAVSYKVGSFCDPDGADRHSLTPNAFWATTGFIARDPSLKSAIVECVDAVSSKYGLKTFDVPFSKGTKGVGRIAKIVPGTYENACAYVHCSLFGTMALFALGESERAWREIERSIVITHENATLTSFVMPNSYCENPEYDIDGESLSDWHTGSGCVLVKEIVKYGFGVMPTLSGVKVAFPKSFPSERGKLEIDLGRARVTVKYEKRGGERTLGVEGARAERGFDALAGVPTVFIPREELNGNITVSVTE